MTEWKKYIKSPDIKQKLDWTAAKEQAAAIHKENKLTTSLMATGLFEQSHYLMGFEDTLMNLLLEPEAMGELLDYITDYKLTYAQSWWKIFIRTWCCSTMTGVPRPASSCLRRSGER